MVGGQWQRRGGRVGWLVALRFAQHEEKRGGQAYMVGSRSGAEAEQWQRPVAENRGSLPA